MDRLEKNIYYLQIAKQVATRGTCLRRNYGSVIVKNDRIVSTGYTGAPSGRKNCCDLGFCKRQEQNIPRGERYELCISGDTKILMEGRKVMRIDELYDLNMEMLPDGVWIYSNSGKEVKPEASSKPIYMGRKQCIRIVFSNGKHIDCTPDHKFLTVCHTYVRAVDLCVNDVLLGWEFSEIKQNSSIPKPYAEKEYAKTPVFKLYRIAAIHGLDALAHVYDISVPNTENFAIALTNHSGIFAHNCRSVHSEENAIIHAARDDMLGATLYLCGIENDGSIVKDACSCAMCKRVIINAGIEKVIVMDHDNTYHVIPVSDWIENDDSLTGSRGY